MNNYKICCWCGEFHHVDFECEEKQRCLEPVLKVFSERQQRIIEELKKEEEED